MARRGRPKVRRGPAASHDFNRKDPRPSGQRRTNCASPASRSTSAAAQFRQGPGKQTGAPGPVFVIRGHWARDGGFPLQFRISCAVYGATGGAGTPGGAGAAYGAAGGAGGARGKGELWRHRSPAGCPFIQSAQYDSFSDSEDESQSRRGHEIAFVKSIDSVEQGRSSNQMSDNDHGGRESASSKVRFHTQGKESKGSYASSSRSGGKSYVYEEEGESERSQQWGPQIGGKCERDFIGYSNSYNGNSNRRQQQLKASAQGRYGEVTCSRDAELQGGFGREDSFFCKEDSLSEGYGSVTSERSAPEYPFQRESAKAGRRCSISSRR